MKTLKLLSILVLIISITYIFSQRNNDKNERWDTDNPVTLNGTITEVDHPLAKFKSDNGTEYQVHMGPYWYWQDNKYELQKEVKAIIKAEVDGKDIYPWEIEQSGNKMYFTDDNGVPKWSKGNGKGNGKGWKNGNGYNGKGKGKCWR
jgi:hypothetical protein